MLMDIYMDKSICIFIPELGNLKITASDKGIISLEFVKRKTGGSKRHGAHDTSSAVLNKAGKELRLYAQGRLKKFSVPVDISRVSGFTKLVLQKTKKISYGRTLSYKQLAFSLGNGNASRAVGNSLGKNPVPIIIPCHRVIKSDGSLGGYSSGIAMKKKLLGIEKIFL
jgi:methylated-DNA-[protein]-cysteine S-methyltransferase